MESTTGVLPPGAKYVRLTGVVGRRSWLVYRHEDKSDPVSIAPLVGEHWKPLDPVRYFVVADGEDPSAFRQKGLIRISGEPGGANRDIENRALESYRSKGLKIDKDYVIVKSKDLPNEGYVPVDYSALTGPSLCGAFLALVTFVSLAIGRYEDKRKIVHIFSPAAPPRMGVPDDSRAFRTDKSPGNALEFPYRFKGRLAITLLAFFTLLAAFAFLLASDRTSPAEFILEVLSVHYGFFLLLVPVTVLLIPFLWFRTRGQVLRITASELTIGNLTVPLNEVQSVRIIKSGWTRSMIVQAGKRKAGINQMMLPDAKAFDEIVRALTSGRFLNNPG